MVAVIVILTASFSPSWVLRAPADHVRRRNSPESTKRRREPMSHLTLRDALPRSDPDGLTKHRRAKSRERVDKSDIN